MTVFCYIEKKDVNDIFEGRKRLVGQLYQKACELESAADYGQALKYLYFAVILMKSVPEQEIRAGSMNLVLEIPQHISAIIQSLTFSVKSDRDVGTDERAIELTIRRGEKPVRSIEFAFWDGSNQVNVQALDGEGSVRLYGPSVNFTKLDIGVKYSYYESRGELQEVEDLWTVVEKPTFKNVKRILLSRSEAPATEQRSDSSGAPRMEPATKETSAVAAPIGAGVQECITLINAGDEQAIRSRYGEDPFLADKLAALVRYNRPRIVDDAAAASVHRIGSGWEVRRLKTLTRYSTLKMQAGEYLILDFSAEGKLEDVNFGIMDQLYDEFVEQGRTLGDWERRQVIIKFMERYRTAYMTRSMAMLDSLFADDAVIIIGRILKRNPQADMYAYAKQNEDQPDYQALRYTKEQYLRNQRLTFARQPDIFIGYNSFKMLRKNNQPLVYGISMRQSYASTSYADEGYLFLLVDFNSASPQIYVRSWQPKEWNDDSLVKLSNFHVNR